MGGTIVGASSFTVTGDLRCLCCGDESCEDRDDTVKAEEKAESHNRRGSISSSVLVLQTPIKPIVDVMVVPQLRRNLPALIVVIVVVVIVLLAAREAVKVIVKEAAVLSEVPQVLLLVYVRASELRARKKLLSDSID